MPTAERADAQVSVYDGSIYCGEVISRGGHHHAIDPDGRTVGVFSTQREAACALPGGDA